MDVYDSIEELAIPDFEDYKTPDGHFDFAALQDAEREYLDNVIGYAERVGTPHPLNGKVVQTPFADGQAVYVIFKRGPRVSLISIGTGDAWRDPQLEALATVKYLTELVKRQEAFAAHWAKTWGTPVR